MVGEDIRGRAAPVPLTMFLGQVRGMNRGVDTVGIGGVIVHDQESPRVVTLGIEVQSKNVITLPGEIFGQNPADGRFANAPFVLGQN